MSGWVKAGKVGWSAIKGVLPKVNKTKLGEAKSKLAIAIQKSKGSKAKLKQTEFEIQNTKFKGKDFTFAPKGKAIKESDRKKQIIKDNSKVIGRMFKKALESKK